MTDKTIIAVSHDMLESLDQLFYSGSKGTHLLFSTRTIRAAFDRRRGLEEMELDEAAERLQPILADLMEIDDLEDRRDYIERLETPVRDLLVHLYFGFLERYLTDDEEPEVLH